MRFLAAARGDNYGLIYRAGIACVLLLLVGRVGAVETMLGPLNQKVVSLTSSPWEPYIGPSMPGEGYIYQLVSRAFSAVGYRLQVGYYPWARAVHNARSTRRYSGVFPEYYSPAREDDFVFSDPFPCGPISLFKRRGSNIEFTTSPREDQEQALSELRQYRFGVVRGYINTEVLDNAEYLRREESRSDELNLRKLRFGRIDLAAIDPYVARHLLDNELVEYQNDLVRMQPALEAKSVHIAFSRRNANHKELAAAFNAGLAQLKQSGELESLLKQYGFEELADQVRAEITAAE